MDIYLTNAYKNFNNNVGNFCNAIITPCCYTTISKCIEIFKWLRIKVN